MNADERGLSRRLSRRAFVAATLAAGVAVAQEKRRIPVGLLGGAHSHAFEKARLLAAGDAWDFVGIVEPDPKVSARYAQAGLKTIDRDELFRRAGVVVVESAVKDLGPFALEALRAGKHVHVEKPPTTTLDQMRELVALAGERGRLLQAGYMWRYNPAVNAALRAAREGWLGRVFQLRAAMHTTVAADRRPEWAPFKGGAMFEQGCHLVDMMVRLLGRPKDVTAVLRKHGDFPDDRLMDNNLAVLEWDGALGTISNSTLQPNAGPHRFFEILGTNGTAVVRPIEPPTLTVDLQKPAGPYKAGTNAVKPEAYQRYAGDFAELAAAVRGEGRLSVSPDEELMVQEAVLRASGM